MLTASQFREKKNGTRGFFAPQHCGHTYPPKSGSKRIKKNGRTLPKPPSDHGATITHIERSMAIGDAMATIEIRIASAEITARMDEVRHWLRQRGCAYKLTSTGSRDERVVVIDFLSGADADEFARRFGGNLVAGSTG